MNNPECTIKFRRDSSFIEWRQNGKLHRLDGPALEHANDDKLWYQNGLRHRLNGPAVEWADGDKWWYINGVRMTEVEHSEGIRNE